MYGELTCGCGVIERCQVLAKEGSAVLLGFLSVWKPAGVRCDAMRKGGMGWTGKQNECGAATCNPCSSSPKYSSMSIRSQCAASIRHLTAPMRYAILCCVACCHAGVAAAAAGREILSEYFVDADR